MDNDERAHVRFGDGAMGRRPDAGMTFTARYRIGNGRAGNVGAETIACLVLRQGTLSGSALTPRNPLPAQSGTDPEPMAEVKLFAPGAFRKDMQRAITADDYAQLAQRNTKMQRAAAQLRWTGSWYEARVALDPLGTEEPSDTLLPQMTRDLYRYRRMGHDLAVTRARYVPLDVALTVCVLPHYLRGHVEAALLDVFSTRVLPHGTRGFFHPDNLTFGAGVALSALVAAAQAVPGVLSVKVTKLERLYEGPNDELPNGILRLGSDEIAQLDNDPSFPEHGKLTLTMEGGR
jgi:predicted phage baseplate assembly protein